MEENCCRNCIYAKDYTGYEAFYCVAYGCCIRGEQYNCKEFDSESNAIEDLD